MKKINEYINSKNTFDILDEQLLKHLNIAYAFNKESISEYFTFESLGLFKGCKEIVNICIDKIINRKTDKLIINKNNINIKDIFFEILIIECLYDNSNSIYGEYKTGYIDDELDIEYNNKRWDSKRSIFNKIEINLYNINNSENDIAEILTHELIHAWDDYIVHKILNSSMRNININNKLKSEFKTIRNNIVTQKIQALCQGEYDKSEILTKKLDNFDFIEKLIYYLNNFEINSYIGQINTILRNKKYDNVKDALYEIIDKSASYNNYKYIYDIAFTDKNNLFIEYGASKSQLNIIRKFASKAWKKIINHTYHICIDNISNKINEGSSLIFLKDKQIKIWKR